MNAVVVSVVPVFSTALGCCEEVFDDGESVNDVLGWRLVLSGYQYWRSSLYRYVNSMDVSCRVATAAPGLLLENL